MGIIQQASGTFTNAGGTVTPTLPSASSASNVVVVIFAGNTTVSTPGGFTLRTSQVNFMGHYLWDRAGGSAAYNFTTAAGQGTWWIGEIDSGVYDGATSANLTSADVLYSTPNLTPTAGSRSVVASIASVMSGAIVRTVSSWTNSFSEQDDLCQASADYPMQGIAVLDVTADGSTAYSTTATYSASSTGRSAIIAAYVTAGGTNAGTLAASAPLLTASLTDPPFSTLSPTGLTATVISDSEIDLSWSAMPTATGYDVEADGSVVSANQPGTTYADTGLSPSQTRNYRVRGVR